MVNRIDCELNNGLDGDARKSLVLREARDVLSDAPNSAELVLCVETNGDPYFVDVTDSRSGSLATACQNFGCTLNALKSAVIHAYPPAANWDWATNVNNETAPTWRAYEHDSDFEETFDASDRSRSYYRAPFDALPEGEDFNPGWAAPNIAENEWEKIKVVE